MSDDTTANNDNSTSTQPINKKVDLEVVSNHSSNSENNHNEEEEEEEEQRVENNNNQNENENQQLSEQKPKKQTSNNTNSNSANNNNNNNAENENDTNSDANNQSSSPNADTFYTRKAHITRRIWHVCTLTCMPIFYFWVGPKIADGMHISLPKILSFVMFVCIILEGLRIHKRFIVFGMREYEKYHISANAWGIIGMCIVFLLAFPRTHSVAPAITHDQNGNDDTSKANACFGQIAIPIMWTLSIGDPLLGELKRYRYAGKLKPWVMYLIAEIVIALLWLICYFWCGTPFWLCIIIPPIAIAAEKPSIKDIDDNGVMLLVPLLFTIMLEPWFPNQCHSV